MHIFKDTNYDFLRWRWHAIALSALIIVGGIVTIATRGLSRGVEFAGGTVVIERFDQPVSIQQVRSALEAKFGQNLSIQEYGDPSQRQVMIRVPQVGAEAGASLGNTADAIEGALKQANLGGFTRLGTEIV